MAALPEYLQPRYKKNLKRRLRPIFTESASTSGQELPTTSTNDVDVFKPTIPIKRAKNSETLPPVSFNFESSGASSFTVEKTAVWTSEDANRTSTASESNRLQINESEVNSAVSVANEPEGLRFRSKITSEPLSSPVSAADVTEEKKIGVFRRKCAPSTVSRTPPPDSIISEVPATFYTTREQTRNPGPGDRSSTYSEFHRYEYLSRNCRQTFAIDLDGEIEEFHRDSPPFVAISRSPSTSSFDSDDVEMGRKVVVVDSSEEDSSDSGNSSRRYSSLSSSASSVSDDEDEEDDEVDVADKFEEYSFRSDSSSEVISRSPSPASVASEGPSSSGYYREETANPANENWEMRSESSEFYKESSPLPLEQFIEDEEAPTEFHEDEFVDETTNPEWEYCEIRSAPADFDMPVLTEKEENFTDYVLEESVTKKFRANSAPSVLIREPSQESKIDLFKRQLQAFMDAAYEEIDAIYDSIPDELLHEFHEKTMAAAIALQQKYMAMDALQNGEEASGANEVEA